MDRVSSKNFFPALEGLLCLLERFFKLARVQQDDSPVKHELQ